MEIHNGTRDIQIDCPQGYILFEGYVKGERPKGLKFVFYNYDLKITIIPSVFEWDGDTFRMMLHVEQANENNPISSGDYYPIAVDGKGKQYPLQVAKSIIEEREQAEWKMMWSLTKEKDIM